MIFSECAILFFMIASGALSAFLGKLLCRFGAQLNKVASAICDLLASLIACGIFFCILSEVAKGELRLYEVAAFLLGIFIGIKIFNALLPHIARVLYKVIIRLLIFTEKVSKPLHAFIEKIGQKCKQAFCTLDNKLKISERRKKLKIARQNKMLEREKMRRKKVLTYSKKLRKKKQKTPRFKLHFSRSK